MFSIVACKASNPHHRKYILISKHSSLGADASEQLQAESDEFDMGTREAQEAEATNDALWSLYRNIGGDMGVGLTHDNMKKHHEMSKSR